MEDKLFVFTKSELQEVDKAVEYFNENYFAADIFRKINQSIALNTPDITAEERTEKSLGILRTAEEKFYNQPLDERNIIQEFQAAMKETMDDFKDMMMEINRITEKGKATIKKVFHNEKEQSR